MAGEVLNPRFAPITFLSEKYNLLSDYNQLSLQEERAEYLYRHYKITPTIGCELEVKFSSLRPELAREFFGEQDAYGRFERSYNDLPPALRAELDLHSKAFELERKQAYHDVWQAGIPKGKDAFWEFAHSPTYAWQTLAHETRLLFESGLVPEGFEHSLHVTLAADPTGGGLALVLAGLELEFVKPERIESATHYHRLDKRSGWARKGTDGQRVRTADQLRLGASTAVEFRTLATDSSIQTTEILRTSQLLAAALLAFRQRHDIQNPVIRAIAGLWPIYRGTLYNLWTERRLPIGSWGDSHENPKPWIGWADCLGRRDEADSIEAEAVRVIGNIVLTTEILLNELL